MQSNKISQWLDLTKFKKNHIFKNKNYRKFTWAQSFYFTAEFNDTEKLRINLKTKFISEYLEDGIFMALDIKPINLKDMRVNIGWLYE